MPIATIVSAHHHLAAVATRQQTAMIALPRASTVAIVNDLQDHHAVATMTTLLHETTEAEHLLREIPTDRHRETLIAILIVIPFLRGPTHRSHTHRTTLAPEAHRVLTTTIVAVMEEPIPSVDIN
jgi:hypothetical protein